MTRRLLLAPFAFLLLTPAAHATDPGEQVLRANCGYDLAPWVEVSVGDLTVGQRYAYRGLAYGYALLHDSADPAGSVSGSFRCEIRKNGVPVASTPVSHGTTAIAAAGPVTFSADPYDVLSLCAVVDLDAGGTYELCGDETQSQVPPQEITDALDAVLDLALEPLGPALCAVTGGDAVLDSPVPFFVGVGSRNGEITFDDGDLRYDCP